MSLSNAALVTAVVVVGFLGMVYPKVDLTNLSVGGSAGPEFYDRLFFKDNVVVGGGSFATTSQGAATYTASNIVNNRLILHRAPGALTATLPTKASFNSAGFLQYPGDTYSMYIYASTTAITIAGNTGVRLDSASTTNNINAAGVGKLEFIRLPATEDSDIEVRMTTGE
jgi:hypothetical protein